MAASPPAGRSRGRSHVFARALSSAPVLTSVRGYQRSWRGGDALAGLSLLVIAVPAQLATARLAGMPPVTGLYALVAGTVMFALLGSNPQMSVGADSTIAPLIAVGVAHLAASGSARYVGLVGLLAVAVGLIVVLVGLLRLGWVAELLSAPIITGFFAGVAVIIITHQLSDLFGLPATSGPTLHRIATIIRHRSQTNDWTLGTGLGVLAVIAAAHRIDRRLPGAFVGLVISTVLVAGLGLSGHGIAVLGPIAHAAPHLGLPVLSWSAIRSVLPIAAVVALVVVSQSAATTREAADRGGYGVDVGRDFVGVGAGSVLAGLTGSFAVNASPPCTAAVASAGGRSQLAGLGAAAIVAGLVLPFAGILEHVPLATLAAVLISVAVRIFHGRDLAAVRRFDAWEFGLAMITLLTVALVGVEEGIGVAVGLAVLDRTRLSARPQAHVLARIPGTTSWEPIPPENRPIPAPGTHAGSSPRPNEVPGVLVLLFAAPLYFANAGHFRGQIDAALDELPSPPRLLVLDIVGMHDIDFTGARALGRTLDELDRMEIAFALARAGTNVRENLSRSGLLDRIGRDRVFPSVNAAVTALGPERVT